MTQSKEGLKRRVKTLETVVSDGIDQLILEVRRLDGNIRVLAEALEQHDTTIAALRAIIVESDVATDDEIDAKRKELEGIRNKVREEAERKAEEANKKYANVDPELKAMHKAAVEAKDEHPKEAFIFDG